ncbi:MAG TPA: glycosyltransferase family 4 protein [Gaiellaceae bacterium]|jgi:glycosyltransferase involved in cell wall biosynthesis
MTQVILEACRPAGAHLSHFDTSDHREISGVGKVDLKNLALAGLHAFKLASALGRERHQIVHLPLARNRLGFWRDAVLIIIARLARCRVVVHFHSRDFASFARQQARWMRALIRIVLAGRVYAIVLGESRRRDFEGFVEPNRIAVVPNGIADFGKGTPAGERAATLLHLGTLSREKGVFDVLEATRRVRRVVGHVRVVCAGEWYRKDDRERAERFVNAHDLRDIIEFAGPVEGVTKRRLLQEAAVMVFPTHYEFEGHPLVVLEALCAGTPIVTTPLGAIPDTIDDGIEGFLIPEGDIDALSQRLTTLLQNREMRETMGNAARSRYERQFTAEQFARRLERVWEQIADVR